MITKYTHCIDKMFGILVIVIFLARLAQACGLEMVFSSFLRRDSDCRLRGPEVKQIPSDLASNTTYLEVKATHVRVVPAGVLFSLQHLEKVTIQQNKMLEIIEAYAFSNLPRLSSLFISENVALKKIGAFAFSNLPELTEITITKARNLLKIDHDAFRNIPKLRYLLISNTGLNLFPDLGQIHSTATELIFDFHDNMHITEVPTNAFRGLCSQAISEVRLKRNGIERVASNAFNGTKMHKLFLGDNKRLSHFSTDAFPGPSELVVLDISSTSLRTVPGSILGSLRRIIAKSSFSLKKFPLFTTLREANLTYPSHCCAFQYMYNRSKEHPLCTDPQTPRDSHLHKDLCGSPFCSPMPDDFNPCEDIMADVSQRVLIWVMSILALIGNTAVLLVLLGTKTKLTVPRFLMCHLALADLCMGVYLVVIATVDVFTRGQYYNYAIDWQTGLGCSAAGFFTVFASELSVFTLTAITLERWHTITHALRLDRKLRLRHACFVMTGGWLFSLITAVLPTLGVSSYSKVSICLPMDVDSVISQIYVILLLILNILAFLCVCACYLSIYLTIRNPRSAPAHADTRVAKRMALLIFTDFLCMAPISFFALSAALKLPLITVSEAKFLLVLFYPINSCSNPFLYAFCTRTFRRDLVLMAARFGVCKTRAQIYRTETSSCQQPAWTSPKSSHVMLYSLATTLHSIDSKHDL